LKNNQIKYEKQSIKKVVDTNETKKKESPKKELGGSSGLEPTRYGDWEKNGRCIDF